MRCAPLTEKDIDDAVELRGTIAPLFGKDAIVAPQVAGRVLRVLVREGDRVRAGQELARIDDATLVDQAHQADAVVAKAQAETALARTTEARVRRVVDRGIAARQELDDASARLATAQAGEAEARATSDIARRQLGRATLRSPIRGVVLKVFRKPGELVDGTPATAVVEVGDPTTLDLVATASGADLVRVRAAAHATVTVPVMPGRTFGGTVSLVSPAVDRATGLGSVRVRLDPIGGDGQVAPPIGVAGVARISAGTKQRTLLAPSQALRAPTGADAEIVVCGADRRAHVVAIVVEGAGNGDGNAGLVAIQARAAPGQAALAPGTAVVVEPVLGVHDGDSIETAP